MLRRGRPWLSLIVYPFRASMPVVVPRRGQTGLSGRICSPHTLRKREAILLFALLTRLTDGVVSKGSISKRPNFGRGCAFMIDDPSAQYLPMRETTAAASRTALSRRVSLPRRAGITGGRRGLRGHPFAIPRSRATPLLRLTSNQTRASSSAAESRR